MFPGSNAILCPSGPPEEKMMLFVHATTETPRTAERLLSTEVSFPVQQDLIVTIALLSKYGRSERKAGRMWAFDGSTSDGSRVRVKILSRPILKTPAIPWPTNVMLPIFFR